jgi:CMP-N-acetylneuraminic acid synthetase
VSRDVFAVVPARGGSKGIPGKNLVPLAGRPLLAWTIEAARAASCIAQLIVSTDDEAIASAARALGAGVPFLRPAELAHDHTPGIEPILHAVETLAVSAPMFPTPHRCSRRFLGPSLRTQPRARRIVRAARVRWGSDT